MISCVIQLLVVNLLKFLFLFFQMLFNVNGRLTNWMSAGVLYIESNDFSNTLLKLQSTAKQLAILFRVTWLVWHEWFPMSNTQFNLSFFYHQSPDYIHSKNLRGHVFKNSDAKFLLSSPVIYKKRKSMKK